MEKELIVGFCTADGLEESKKEHFGVYLESILSEKIKLFRGELLYRKHDRVYFLLEVFSAAENSRKYNRLKEEIQKLNSIMENQFATSVTCILSHSGVAKQLPLLYQECDNVLKHRLYLGKGKLLIAEKIQEQKQINVSPVNAEEVRNYIAKFDYEHMNEYLQKVMCKLVGMRVTSTDFVKGICLEIKNILIEVISEKGVDVGSIFENNQILLNDIPNYCELNEFYTWIDNLCYVILRGLTQLTGQQHSRVIIKAVDYISQNYASEINLEVTADYVNKSKYYFSYLFKKEIGMSFVEYLNFIRVDQAKILLNTTDAMTYEISEKVGYSDYKYFSSVFKKNTGMTPVQYRKRKEQ